MKMLSGLHVFWTMLASFPEVAAVPTQEEEHIYEMMKLCSAEVFNIIFLFLLHLK